MPRYQGFEQSSSDSAATSGGTKNACQECRLNKIKCSFAPQASRCDRCEKCGFDCTIVTGMKRGRKPRSKVAALGRGAIPPSSSPRSAITRAARCAPRTGSTEGLQGSNAQEPSSARLVCPLLTDHALRNRAWQVVARIPATRGSTYNFVSAGDADVSTLRSQRAAAVGTSASSRSSLVKPACTTLRTLLHPVLHSEEGTAQHDRAASTPGLPRTINFAATRNLRGALCIDEARITELISYFMQHLQPWVAVLCYDPSHLSLCPLLFASVCYQASKYSNGPASETAALASHCRMLCIIAFAETRPTVALVLAFYLLAAWKTADDDFTDSYVSYADQVARQLAFGSADNPDSSRQVQRIEYFHYVQRHVSLLHHGSSNNYDRYPPGARSPKELTKRLLEWSQSPESLAGDWFLCADVESTSIQCRYAVAFTERHDRQLSTGTHSIADVISSKSLLDQFVGEMVEWEERWSCEGFGPGGRKRKGSTMSSTQQIEHEMGFGLFKNSVRGHVASFALKDALKTWLQERRSSNRAALSSASLSLTEEYLNSAYLVCLESMLGTLQQFVPLRRERAGHGDVSQSSSLLHAPDSLVILADHAALMVVYLLLLPGVLAEVSFLCPCSSSSSSSSSSGRRQDAAHPHIASMVHTAERCAQDCIDTLQEVRDQMKCAATTRIRSCTAVHLSVEYLADLIELAGNSSSTWSQDIAGAQAGATYTNESVQDVMPSHFGAALSERTPLSAANGVVGCSEPAATASTTSPNQGHPFAQEPIDDGELFHEWLQSFLRDTASDGHCANGSADMDFPMPSFM